MPLRTILIGLGILIAILPYLGFPSWFNAAVYTLAGLGIVFLLTLFQKIRTRWEAKVGGDGTPPRPERDPRVLHVTRKEVEEYPYLHVEKETTLDLPVQSQTQAGTKHILESPDEDTTIEKKVTVVRLPERSRSQSGTRRMKDADGSFSVQKP